MLEPGAEAPDFILPDQDGARIRLAAYRGKPVVLFFYPRDMSRSCTKEAHGFRDAYSELRSLGAAVLGVSRDSSESHTEFRERHDLPYPLLTDAEGQVARQFRVPKFLGLLPGRTTYVIDASGVIRMVYSSAFDFTGHSTRALEFVRRMNGRNAESTTEQIGV